MLPRSDPSALGGAGLAALFALAGVIPSGCTLSESLGGFTATATSGGPFDPTPGLSEGELPTEDPSPSGSGSEGGDSGADTTGITGMTATAGATGIATTDDPETTRGDDATTTGATGDANTGDPTGDTAGPPTCDPAANDDACELCVKAACCDPYLDCLDDPLCACTVACLSGGNPPPTCIRLCEPDAVYTAYITCLAASCAPECV